MGFMFCDLHVSLNNPSSGDNKFVEFALLILILNKLVNSYIFPLGKTVMH